LRELSGALLPWRHLNEIKASLTFDVKLDLMVMLGNLDARPRVCQAMQALRTDLQHRVHAALSGRHRHRQLSFVPLSRSSTTR